MRGLVTITDLQAQLAWTQGQWHTGFADRHLPILGVGAANLMSDVLA